MDTRHLKRLTTLRNSHSPRIDAMDKDLGLLRAVHVFYGESSVGSYWQSEDRSLTLTADYNAKWHAKQGYLPVIDPATGYILQVEWPTHLAQFLLDHHRIHVRFDVTKAWRSNGIHEATLERFEDVYNFKLGHPADEIDVGLGVARSVDVFPEIGRRSFKAWMSKDRQVALRLTKPCWFFIDGKNVTQYRHSSGKPRLGDLHSILQAIEAEHRVHLLVHDPPAGFIREVSRLGR